MRIITEKKVLQSVVKNAIKAKAGRTTIEVLKCLKIEANKEKQEIKITGSNIELFISERFNATVYEEGVCLVAATFFAEAINKCDGEIEIVVESGTMKINSGSMKLNVVTMNPDDFPKPKKIKDDNVHFVMEKEAFQRLVGKTIFAASSDEVSGIICGILLDITQNNITAVGLDGFRVSTCSTSIEVDGSKKIIIKARLLNEISKVLAKTDAEEIKIIADDQVVRFDFDKTRIIVSMLSGEYFKYNEVFPTTHYTSVLIDKKELYNAVDRSTILSFSDNANKHNLVKFQIGKDHVMISSTSQIGNVSQEVPAKVTGNDLLIGFNARYVLEALKKIEEDEVKLEFQSGVKPLIIRIPDNERFKQLILPVRINN